MEITSDLLESLTTEDIAKILDYRNLLIDAKMDVEAIRETYKFKIGEEKITIWNDEHNVEYLTHNGVWQARYLHQTYDLPVTVDAVFEAYKELYNEQRNPRKLVNNIADGAKYFKSFAQKARKLMAQIYPNWAVKWELKRDRGV